MSAILALDNVSLGYGQRTILKDISLTVAQGEVVALMGGSGSGKTTLLRAATGQLKARSGSIKLFGQEVNSFDNKSLREARQRMGVLFQQGALFTDLNVFENVAFPLREHLSLPNEQLQQTVLDKLAAVGLRAAAHLKVSEISGGMARRVALARAIVMNPELILYDEPFAGLDPIAVGVTARLIRHLSTTLHCGSLIITHDVAETFEIADQVYLIGQGAIKAKGTPAELRDAVDPYVEQFLRGLPDGPVKFDYPLSAEFEAWLVKHTGCS
ncbi:phospholipid/cholesterol/gamma-HCH transport system ATP-binding protein [Jezberella montanilacus]|uniref:Phospholipid/cholesterol/gamma-HCH transport system ATP-binding protein n=1 Tax=Jezberella montanilacus TaxID=323426 RepID=A0A2T0XHJ1_9BURK|nr:ABC transporter ATP-binding protein [Jezberella montanilacus]PRY98382.1 phospholipid/cholesterol/gamma-HCH transport system ATP-binding protein [Jezberella montanilacus]